VREARETRQTLVRLPQRVFDKAPVPNPEDQVLVRRVDAEALTRRIAIAKAHRRRAS